MVVRCSVAVVFQFLTGRTVTGQTCAAPDNSSATFSDLQDVEWNATYVTYGQCEIIVSKDNLSGDAQQFSCPFGYNYGYRKELSFRTEVCLGIALWFCLTV